MAGRAPRAARPESEDWEETLRRRNAANDDLCSENCRLRAEIERLRAEPEGEWAQRMRSAVQAAVGGPEVASSEAGARLEALLGALGRAMAEAECLPEETAQLVQEKIALRGLVEEQMERIQELEGELHDLGAAPSGGPFGVTLPDAVARSLSGAGGALHAGLSAVLSSPTSAVQSSPTSVAKAPAPATVGAEYEIISNLGAIVRRSESLRSAQVAELPAGSRVKVVALSRRDPRRVEIVAAQGEAGPVVGWVSASARDGRPLVRQVGGSERGRVVLSGAEWEGLHEARAAAARRAAGLSAEATEMGKELAQAFEMRTVLRELQASAARAAEWEAALRRRAEAASSALRRTRPSAPARDGVQGAGEAEAARDGALPDESRPASGSGSSRELGPDASRASEVERTRLGGAAAAAPEAVEAEPRAPSGGGAPAPLDDGPVALAAFSSRETSASATAAALQRIASLEWERDELERRASAADGDVRHRLSHLRAALRQAVVSASRPGAGERSFCCGSDWGAGAVAMQARPIDVARGGGAVGVGESLFARRLEDLRHTVDDIREELRKAADSETDLQRSLSARSAALRRILRLGALASLGARAGQDVERHALRLAIEEQLRQNLELRRLRLREGRGAR